MALKHIDDPEAIEKIDELTDHLREVGSTAAGIQLLGALIRYLFCAGPKPPHDAVLERIKALLPSETGELMITFAEHLKNTGIEIGRSQGQNELFQHMLQTGLTPERINELTGGSLAQIRQVQAAMNGRA